MRVKVGIFANQTMTKPETLCVSPISGQLASGTVIQPLGSSVQALLYANGHHGVRLGNLFALQHAPHMLGNAVGHPAWGNGDVAIAGGNAKPASHVWHLLGQGVADVLGAHAATPCAMALLRV